MARRLAAAELLLGARLFERLEGTLRPTRAGETAIARAARIEEEVRALEGGIGEGDAGVAGVVRLTAVPFLINRILVPALPRLRVAHPRIQLELVAEPRNLSLTRREADMALRLARPERGGSATTKRIGRLGYAAYGPRGLAAGDLAWIGYEEGQRHLPQARWLADAGEGGPAPPLLVSDAETLAQAIAAGLGRSLLPCCVADADQQLERLGSEIVLLREVWLLTHGDLRRHGRVQAVIAWLEALFAGLS